MYKKIFLLSMLAFIGSVMCMKNKKLEVDLNEQNEMGLTAMHKFTMTCEQMIEYCKYFKNDKNSGIADKLIHEWEGYKIFGGSQDLILADQVYDVYKLKYDKDVEIKGELNINIKNKAGLTAWDYAQKNQSIFPRVFSLIDAINIVSNKCIFSSEELIRAQLILQLYGSKNK